MLLRIVASPSFSSVLSIAMSTDGSSSNGKNVAFESLNIQMSRAHVSNDRIVPIL